MNSQVSNFCQCPNSITHMLWDGGEAATKGNWQYARSAADVIRELDSAIKGGHGHGLEAYLLPGDQVGRGEGRVRTPLSTLNFKLRKANSPQHFNIQL
jgi:hypothetical protein